MFGNHALPQQCSMLGVQEKFATIWVKSIQGDVMKSHVYNYTKFSIDLSQIFSVFIFTQLQWIQNCEVIEFLDIKELFKKCLNTFEILSKKWAMIIIWKIHPDFFFIERL